MGLVGHHHHVHNDIKGFKIGRQEVHEYKILYSSMIALYIGRTVMTITEINLQCLVQYLPVQEFFDPLY